MKEQEREVRIYFKKKQAIENINQGDEFKNTNDQKNTKGIIVGVENLGPNKYSPDSIGFEEKHFPTWLSLMPSDNLAMFPFMEWTQLSIHKRGVEGSIFVRLKRFKNDSKANFILFARAKVNGSNLGTTGIKGVY